MSAWSHEQSEPYPFPGLHAPGGPGVGIFSASRVPFAVQCEGGKGWGCGGAAGSVRKEAQDTGAVGAAGRCAVGPGPLRGAHVAHGQPACLPSGQRSHDRTVCVLCWSFPACTLHEGDHCEHVCNGGMLGPPRSSSTAASPSARPSSKSAWRPRRQFYVLARDARSIWLLLIWCSNSVAACTSHTSLQAIWHVASLHAHA